MKKIKFYFFKTTFFSFLLIFNNSIAVQFGIWNNPHRFPADKSLYVEYGFARGWTSGNFVTASQYQALEEEQTVVRNRHHLGFDYQFSKVLAAGALIQFDQLYLLDAEFKQTNNSMGLSDQWLYLEYRVLDEIGSSLGFSILSKFPLYENVLDLETTKISLGDRDTSFYFMLNGENWFAKNIRGRADLGLGFRTGQVANIIPAQFSLAFVTNKIDLQFQIQAAKAFGQSGTELIETEHGKLGGSYYNFAPGSNWYLNIKPQFELWISPIWGIGAFYQYSVLGFQNTYHHVFGLNVIYRWWKKSRVPTQRFNEADIQIDQNQGNFDEAETERKILDSIPILDAE